MNEWNGLWKVELVDVEWTWNGLGSPRLWSFRKRRHVFLPLRGDELRVLFLHVPRILGVRTFGGVAEVPQHVHDLVVAVYGDHLAHRVWLARVYMDEINR